MASVPFWFMNLQILQLVSNKCVEFSSSRAAVLKGGGLGKIEVPKVLPQSPWGQNIFIIMCACAVLSHFSHVQLFAPLWIHLSMGFTRQEYWSGLPCLHPRDLPDPGIEPASLTSPAVQASSLPSVLPRKIFHHYMKTLSLILSFYHSHYLTSVQWSFPEAAWYMSYLWY